MLSISDWIAFLTSEKNSNTGNIIGFTAVIIAATALIMSVVNSNWGGAIGAALICVVLMIIYFRTMGKYGQHAKDAGKLLRDIMSGDEKDLSAIQERWKKISEEGNQKNK